MVCWVPACIVCGYGTLETETRKLGIATIAVHAACYEKMRADPDVLVLEETSDNR